MTVAGTSAADMFVRVVNERFNELKGRLATLLKVLATEDLGGKRNYATLASAAIYGLGSVVPIEDHPGWLKPLTVVLNEYASKPDSSNAARLLETLAEWYIPIHTHTWAFEVSGVVPFDFDGLYEQYREQSRIPELFDKLINILEQIVQSGEIDSVRIVRSLETLIATLKKSRNGSYLALSGAWDFAKHYIKNYVLAELENLPVLGSHLTALRDTLDETGIGMEKLREAMQTGLRQKIEADCPFLLLPPLTFPVVPPRKAIECESMGAGENGVSH